MSAISDKWVQVQAEHAVTLKVYQQACERIKQAERALDAARKHKAECGRDLEQSYAKLNSVRSEYLHRRTTPA